MKRKKMLVVGIIVSFVVGNITGFSLGVYSTKIGKSFLEDFVSYEKPADISKPIEITRKSFSLNFPGNWKVDTDDEDYDPDHLFRIDSPGSSFIMFFIFDSPTDPVAIVQAQIDAFVPKSIKDTVRTPLTEWGRYIGHGVELKGKVMSLFNGGIRIFSYSSVAKSFLVIEFYYDEDLKAVEPGFRLIESSFNLIE